MVAGIVHGSPSAHLRMVPRSIFPERKIGRLEDGFEASFLVLEGDPLEDVANTQRIALRVKRGELLFPREPELPPIGVLGQLSPETGSPTR